MEKWVTLIWLIVFLSYCFFTQNWQLFWIMTAFFIAELLWGLYRNKKKRRSR